MTGDVVIGTGVTLTVENINVTNGGDLNVGLGSVQQLSVGVGGTILSTPENAEFVGVGIGTTCQARLRHLM